MRKTFNLTDAISQIADQPAQEMTFSELCDAFSAVKQDQTDLRLRKWTEAFGNQSAWSVTTQQIADAHEAMITLGKYSPATANRDLSAIGSVYKWAQKKRIAPRGFVSPTLGVPRAPEKARVVNITDEQINQIIARAKAFPDRRFMIFVMLIIDTGARKSELLNRKWRDVDLDERQIVAEITKTGKPRMLFFSPETAEMIKRVSPRRDPDRLIFEGRIPGKPIDFRRSWANLLKEIGLSDIHIHDMRHHRAAQLLRIGLSAPVVSQVLGHSVQILMNRYGHLDTTTLKDAADRVFSTAA